ncbi:MAG: radical SAM protein [Chloroflexi bacterium]|nr:radical SAM protein [Chloroflexota bacterium]
MKVRHDGNGVHFFDRRTGLNILLDEIRVPAILRDSAPRFVSVALTNACDLQCVFCYAPKHGARLDASQVLSWAIELDRGGCLGLGFGGGEPTLHPAFVALCRQISEATELAVSFTTHGHHLTDAMIGDLMGAVHFVRLSMDGI